MLLVVAVLLGAGWWLGTRPGSGKNIGAMLWATTHFYYAIEYAVLQAPQGTHDLLQPPQNDLRGTMYGAAPYPLSAEYI